MHRFEIEEGILVIDYNTNLFFGPLHSFIVHPVAVLLIISFTINTAANLTRTMPKIMLIPAAPPMMDEALRI